MRRRTYEIETLHDVLTRGLTDDDKEKLYVSMSKNMKFLHKESYAVSNMLPEHITVIDNSIENIKYNEILKIIQQTPEDKKYFEECKRENVYALAIIMIASYTNCLPYITKTEFVRNLKSNFSSFSTFLPEEDVRYYEGVIKNGSSIQYCDFKRAKTEKNIQELNKQFGIKEDSNLKSEDSGNGLDKGRSKVYSNGHSLLSKEESAIPYNELYRQVDDKKAAYVGFYVLTALIFVLSLVLSLLFCIFQFTL